MHYFSSRPISKYTLIATCILCGFIVLLNLKSIPDAIDISAIEEDLSILRSISPEDENYADLQFLKQHLRNKKVVVLGESTHYDGSAFSAKTRLIKFLHKELGYDVLFFELGRYDMWRLQNDSTLSPETAVYPFWCSSAQTQALWDYLRQTKIETAGFDIQCTGNMQDSVRRDLLFNYLSGYGVNAPGRWPEFYSFSKKLTAYSGHQTLNYAINQKLVNKEKLFTELDSITGFLKEQLSPPGRDSIHFEIDTYISYVRGIRNQLNYVQKYDIGAIPRFQWRDSLMAENFIHMMRTPAYKDKKVIVWIANLHAFKDNGQFRDRSFVNWGERVESALKESVYTVLCTSSGRYEQGDNHLYGLSPFNSLEYALYKKGEPYLYISNTHLKALNPVSCGVNQNAFYPLNLGMK